MKPLYWVLPFCLILCSQASPRKSSEVVRTVQSTKDKSTLSGPIEKSPTDENEYRGITLPNRLQVLLVRDLKTPKAGASLSIGVGSMNDPDDLPGLAHVAKRALLLGNQKFPQENGFAEFLSVNGGSPGSTVSEDYTTFTFDVAPSSLYEALDQFVHIFVSPLFLESPLEKEVNVLQEQEDSVRKEDADRIVRVEKEIANSSHPFSRFTIGNRETLWTQPKARGVSLSGELRKFFDKYYSSNIMRLVVLGSQSLDEMQKKVEETFSIIPNKNSEMPKQLEPPYGPEQVQRWISIVPETDIRTLRIKIPVPYTLSSINTKPLEYIQSLVGHEGHGSLLSLLKERNLATALEADTEAYRDFAMFEVSVDLTPEGLNETNEIVCMVFRYIDLLRTSGPQEWYWKERKAIRDLRFQFKGKMEPKSFMAIHSHKLLEIGLERVISAGIVLTEYNASSISDVLNVMTPSRAIVTVVSKSIEEMANLSEKYWGIKYAIEKINYNVIQKWKQCKKIDQLSLPGKNEFIPTDVKVKDLVGKPGIVPQTLLQNDSLSEVWFLQDSEFRLPKASVSLEMYSPLAYSDPLSHWLGYMMTRIVDDLLTESSYSADLAGFSYSLTPSSNGLSLKVSGYNDKLDVLVYKVLDTLTSVNFSQVVTNRFEAIKEENIRQIKNRNLDQPHELARAFLSGLIRDKYWTNEDILSVIEGVTIENVEKYATRFFSQLKLHWLVYGNFVPSEALEITKKNNELFTQRKQTKPLLPSQIVRSRDVGIPAGSNYLYEMKTSYQPSHALKVFYQFGPTKNSTSTLMSRFLEHLTNIPLSTELGTKQQLGHIVGTKTRYFDTTMGFEITVQGSRHPAYVFSRVNSFLNSFIDSLNNNMTQEVFEQRKQSFRAVFVKSLPKTPDYRFAPVWAQIVSGKFNFESEITQQEFLEKLTLSDFKNFVNEYVGEKGRKKKTILVTVLSVSKDGVANNVIAGDEKFESDLRASRISIGSDLTRWKKQMALYAVM